MSMSTDNGPKALKHESSSVPTISGFRLPRHSQKRRRMPRITQPQSTSASLPATLTPALFRTVLGNAMHAVTLNVILVTVDAPCTVEASSKDGKELL